MLQQCCLLGKAFFCLYKKVCFCYMTLHIVHQVYFACLCQHAALALQSLTAALAMAHLLLPLLSSGGPDYPFSQQQLQHCLLSCDICRYKLQVQAAGASWHMPLLLHVQQTPCALLPSLFQVQMWHQEALPVSVVVLSNTWRRAFSKRLDSCIGKYTACIINLDLDHCWRLHCTLQLQFVAAS